MPNKRQQIIASELEKKLRLEKAFRREVRSLFNRIVKDFTVTVMNTGIFPPGANKFIPDWQSALKRHYERVQKAFNGEVLEQQKKCNATWYERKQAEGEDTEAEKAALLALALQKWRDEHSVESAELIAQTTQKNFNEAINEARETILEQDLPTDRRTLALTAAAILKRKFNGRVGGILMFETQQSAESAKLAEAEIESDIRPSILTGLAAAIGIVKKKHGGLSEINESGRIIGRLMGRPLILRNHFRSGVSC